MANETIQQRIDKDYQYGFESQIEADQAPRGLSEDIVRLISSKKGEPEWLLEWRLKAYRHWLTLKEPTWRNPGSSPKSAASSAMAALVRETMRMRLRSTLSTQP